MTQTPLKLDLWPKYAALPLLGLSLLLTGCGADRPAADSQPAAYFSPPPAPAATPSADAAPAAALDPLTTSASSDPMTTSTSDPLIGDTNGPAKDPLAGNDPFNRSKMPTEHSHWLQGVIQNARMQVSLNGIRLGDFSGFVDRDITMYLRTGINTIAFTYQPNSPQSSATLYVMESEHTPPIPPLVTFASVPVSALTATGTPKPQTQMFTFTAR